MSRRLAVTVGVLTALLVGYVGYSLFAAPAQKTATAYFPVAVHLYAGSDIDVLGVKVGRVRSVTPMGDRVKVVLGYDARRKLPAGVSAVVDEPTLVADRVVELTPAYGGGPVLSDGAEIPLGRTGVPLELDDLTRSVTQLTTALGPKGANRSGALSRALTVAASNLHGEGSQAHTTVTQLADLMKTLGDNRDALFDTVQNLQAFAGELASHDAETRAFTTDLATVSQQLADESASFTAALHELGIALNQVSTFVRDNRTALAKDVGDLATVTNVLAKERDLLGQIADMGAVGISNYPHMYTPSARTYNARFDFNGQDNPALFVCQLYGSVGGSPQQCLDNLAPLKQIPLPTGGAK